MSLAILCGSAAVAVGLGALLSCAIAVADDDRGDTATPIRHVIVLIGENRTFDNIYATYEPKHGQWIGNLLSRGIITSAGEPGPNFGRSQQYQINQPYPSTYFIEFVGYVRQDGISAGTGNAELPLPNTAYVPTTLGGLTQGQAPFDPTLVPDWMMPTLEPSFEKEDLGLLRTGASGLPMFSSDTRISNATMLPDG